MSTSHNGRNPAFQLPKPGSHTQVAGIPQTATTDLAPNLALPWVVRLRYGMVAGEAAIIVAMALIFRLDFPVLWSMAPLLVTLASNIALGRMQGLSGRFPQETLGAVFILDTLALTVILGLTGGPANPFSLLYLVQITLSVVVLRKIWTWALGILAAICFGLLFFLHRSLAALQNHHVEQGLSAHLVGMWIAFVIAAGLISFFTGKVSDALRHREREVLDLQEQVAKHERLASLGTLAAGAAHELGTPLSTIAVVAKELEKYASAPGQSDDLREDAKLIRSEVERCRLILERLSVQGGEPMGETARTVQVRDLFYSCPRAIP
jgi:two-component system sensor histidine kinase RegB